MGYKDYLLTLNKEELNEEFIELDRDLDMIKYNLSEVKFYELPLILRQLINYIKINHKIHILSKMVK